MDRNTNTFLIAWATASAWICTNGPIWSRGNTTKLQPNITTNDEPGIYIRGEFGIRLEDDMHVRETGAELFTAQSPSLEDPFGKA
jgi:Xaa-Pro dipeptidase